MQLENQAAESGLSSDNAGGEISTSVTQSEGLSLADSLSKAADSFRTKDPSPRPASRENGQSDTAFETSETQARSPVSNDGSQEEAATSILEAPKHWPQKRRDAFGRFVANQDAQKEWLEHTKELEGEFTRKSQEHADTRKFADGVRELFAPEQRSYMQSNNMTELDAIRHWVTLDQAARRDPAGYAKWFMQQAGLSPQQLFPELGQAKPQAQPEGEAQWVDPDVIKLREELSSLRSEHQALQNHLRQDYAQRQQSDVNARRNALQDTVDAFTAMTDESGNPAHPHYAALEQRMIWELTNNPQFAGKPISTDTLKTVYDIAAWADPTTRQALREAEQAAAQAEAQKRQAAQKAAAAQTLKPKMNSVAGARQAGPTDLMSLIKDAASRAKG